MYLDTVKTIARIIAVYDLISGKVIAVSRGSNAIWCSFSTSAIVKLKILNVMFNQLMAFCRFLLTDRQSSLSHSLQRIEVAQLNAIQTCALFLRFSNGLS
jgi:hypothetical protein